MFRRCIDREPGDEREVGRYQKSLYTRLHRGPDGQDVLDIQTTVQVADQRRLGDLHLGPRTTVHKVLMNCPRDLVRQPGDCMYLPTVLYYPA